MEISRPPRKKAPVNMRLVAEKAGVSATTVSLALRNDPSISQETKERIYTVQRALGYRIKERPRKPLADLPKLEQLIYRVEGLRVDEKSYVPFLNGIIEECRERRIKLELDHSGVEDVEHFLANRDLTNSGVILSGRLHEEQITQIRRTGVPFVVLGNYRFAQPVHMVGLDIVNIAESIISAFKREGYESVVIVLECRKLNFERRFISALRGSMMECGYPVGDENIIETGVNSVHVAEALKSLLALNRPKQAVLTMSHCADHLVMELNASPIKPKHKIDLFSISSSWDFGYSRHFYTIPLAHQEHARFAVQLLGQLVANPAMPPHFSTLDSSRWLNLSLK